MTEKATSENAAELAILLHKAVTQMQAQQIDAAILSFEEIVRLQPDFADGWFNLGYLYRCDRRFIEATQAYGKALELNVDRPEEVHLNRAVIFIDHLDRYTDAQLELERALEINPTFALAWINLGQLYEDLGRPIPAREAYLAALDLAPHNGRAHARLSAIDIFERRTEEAVERLKSVLSMPGILAEDRAEMMFALGAAMDALGRYDDALPVFQAANQLVWSKIPLAARYNPSRASAQVHALKNAFAEPKMSRRSDDLRKNPIFICGLFRSGSTLTEHILSSHSQVVSGGELETIPFFVQKYLQPYPQILSSVAESEWKKLADSYYRELAHLHLECRAVTDKRPDNFWHIGLIKLIFPNARIIHTTRNVNDVAISIYSTGFDKSISYSFRIADIMDNIQNYQNIMSHWQSIYPHDIYTLEYERLIAAPKKEIGQMLEFCGLDWEDACLNDAARCGQVRTASNWQIRAPLHGKSAGRWKNYRRLFSN